MWFGTFFIRTLWLSFIVALFWLPVLVMFGYGVKFLFEVFQNEPIRLGMILVLSIQPIIILLAIFAIRGGLMALKVTRETELNSLAKIVFRIGRMHLPLMWVVTILFGLGTTITGLRLLDNAFVEDFKNAGAGNSGRIASSDLSANFQSASKDSSLLDIGNILEMIGSFPLLLLGGWILGACLAFALFGVSVAAAAATAGVKSRNHHSMWGVASQFVNLFLLTVVLLIAPFLSIVFSLGVETTISELTEVNIFIFYGAIGYATWVICALAADSALAYAIALNIEEQEYEGRMEKLAGAAPTQTVDLKSLRQSRMK